LSEVGNDPSLTSSAAICRWLGKFVDARTHYDNVFSHWDPNVGVRNTAPHDLYVVTLIYLSVVLLCLGYPDQALLRRDEALAEARRLSSPYQQVYAERHAWYGDWATEGARSVQAMLQSSERISMISSEHGFPMFVGVGDIMRGWCLSVVGQAAEGIPLMLQGLDRYRATGTKLVVPFYMMVLAEVYGIAGPPHEALKHVDQAVKMVRVTQERWAEAEMHRLRGTLLLSMNEHAEAEKSYHEALSVARRQSAKFWELRAAMSMARLWRDQGKRNEARELLAPVYGWFTEGFDTRDLKEAKALLEELAA
jgi:predicted ATPase